MIDWLEQHMTSCYFKTHLGIDCPGCGMQRSLIELLKGNIQQSFCFNAALVPFIITVCLLIFQLIAKHKNGGKWVMWSFIFTTSITVVQYVVKQWMFFN